MRKTALLALILLAGCATPPQTPSGRPEHTVYNVDSGCVRVVFMNALVNDGWNIQSSSDLMLRAARPTRNFVAAVLLSTKFGGAPEERIQVTFIPAEPNGLRVVLSGAYVSNQGSAFERPTPVNGTQQDVEVIRAGMERAALKCPAGAAAPSPAPAPRPSTSSTVGYGQTTGIIRPPTR